MNRFDKTSEVFIYVNNICIEAMQFKEATELSDNERPASRCYILRTKIVGDV